MTYGVFQAGFLIVPLGPTVTMFLSQIENKYFIKKLIEQSMTIFKIHCNINYKIIIHT